NERIRLVVTPVYFPVDSKSLQAGKSLDKDFNNKDDISGLIIVSPRVVVLSPGQKRHVRFSVRMKEKMPLGDYRAHLLVNIKESQNPELVSKGAVDGSQTMSIRLNIKLQTAVAVYGRIESPDTKLEVSCEQVEKNKLVIHSRNKSRWNYRGWMGIYQSEDQDPDNPTELIRLINLRESERTINTSQEYNAKRVLRWGLKKEQLNDGVQACSTK
ncbi:hypothetical protein KKA14_19520, partial [bacterium]|nr:hypothetical protein [bacterium]